MAKRVFKANLSVKGIEQLKKDLQGYKDSLNKKCEIFIRRLAESGIIVAQQNVGNFGKYITFSITTNPTATGCKGIMVATNTGIINSEWLTEDGVKSADVNPLLMVEFGSGLRAKNPKNVPGVGTGTFPGQQHASNPQGWWYMDLNGEWHHSYGVTPKMPMYNASIKMHTEINRIAREVFGK